MTTYFRMAMHDADRATDAVWKHQNEAGLELSRFSKRSIGTDLEYSVWTDDPAGEQALFSVLDELHIQYSASKLKPRFDCAFGIGSFSEPLPPQGGSVIAPPLHIHAHTYQVVVSEYVIVRWCPGCGVADKVERTSTSVLFPGVWTRIRE